MAQTPAQHAGLAAGDVIVSVNGKALNEPQHPVADRRPFGRRPRHRWGCERDGQTREVTVTPADGRGVKVGGTTLAPAGASSPHGYIGVQLAQATQSVNPIRAVGIAGATICGS